MTLGSVIRGGTPHFEYVCRGVTDGVREVMRDTGVPVAFGVLTTDDVDQALARAGGAEGNKGETVVGSDPQGSVVIDCSAVDRYRIDPLVEFSGKHHHTATDRRVVAETSQRSGTQCAFEVTADEL